MDMAKKAVNKKSKKYLNCLKEYIKINGIDVDSMWEKSKLIEKLKGGTK